MALQEGSKVAIVEGPDLRTLVAGLNSIGLKADGIIAILQGIKSMRRPSGGARAAMMELQKKTAFRNGFTRFAAIASLLFLLPAMRRRKPAKRGVRTQHAG